MEEAATVANKSAWPEVPLRAVVNDRLPPLPSSSAQSAAAIIRHRRSAQSYDGATPIPRDAFLRMLDALLPRNMGGPWGLLNDQPRLHPILMVHRVEGFTPGLYVMPRRAQAEQMLRAALNTDFAWRSVTANSHPPLFLLAEGDCRGLAREVSCNQDIAADGAFSLGMLAEFGMTVTTTPWRYRRLHEEAGALGQILYLEAEAAGFQGTGIGCFLDDLFHDNLGLQGHAFQTLYHFTVGTGLVDHRLETHPPYAHLSR